MKKILSLQLLGAMLVLLSWACGSKKATVAPGGTGGASSMPAATGGTGAGGTSLATDAGGLGTGGASGSGGLLGTDGVVDAGIPDISYRGCVWMGDLDHMLIKKQDLAQDVCLALQLSSPAVSRPSLAISLPNSWGLMWASFKPCDDTSTAVGATTVTGTITWVPGTVSYLPAAVDVDIVLTFGTPDGGSGETYVFSAKGIPVDDDC